MRRSPESGHSDGELPTPKSEKPKKAILMKRVFSDDDESNARGGGDTENRQRSFF